MPLLQEFALYFVAMAVLTARDVRSTRYRKGARTNNQTSTIAVTMKWAVA